MAERKRTFIAPGFQARGAVAIYKSRHHTRGGDVWAYVQAAMERGENVWLEYGPALSHEQRIGDIVVEVG